MQNLWHLQSLRNRQLIVCLSRSVRVFTSSNVSREGPALPWFVGKEPTIPRTFQQRNIPPHLVETLNALPVPEDAPSILKSLHSQLLESPHLDTTTLTVCQAVQRPLGPPLPERVAHGRRKRGGTYAGESGYDTLNGLWSWFVIAQVKEGTEDRGAIESVVRLVRKSLLTTSPPLPLPPKSRRQMMTGWAMIDAGNFAVHILSKEAREKYFNDDSWIQ